MTAHGAGARARRIDKDRVELNRLAKHGIKRCEHLIKLASITRNRTNALNTGLMQASEIQIALAIMQIERRMLTLIARTLGLAHHHIGLGATTGTNLKERLAHTIFPLAGLDKERDVRRIAAEQGFTNAQKAESEDICFIPDGDYAGYIERRCGHPAAPGDIVWRDGSVVGRHNGALRYTIGQRKGLGVAMAHPVYVTGVDAVNNTVHLGEAEDLTATALTANDWIWSAPADRMEAELDAGGIRVGAKYRYRQKDQAATLTRGAGGQMLLTFDEPQRAIAPGQAVVVYRGDIVLGGGTVTGALK